MQVTPVIFWRLLHHRALPKSSIIVWGWCSLPECTLGRATHPGSCRASLTALLLTTQWQLPLGSSTSSRLFRCLIPMVREARSRLPPLFFSSQWFFDYKQLTFTSEYLGVINGNYRCSLAGTSKIWRCGCVGDGQLGFWLSPSLGEILLVLGIATHTCNPPVTETLFSYLTCVTFEVCHSQIILCASIVHILCRGGSQ